MGNGSKLAVSTAKTVSLIAREKGFLFKQFIFCIAHFIKYSWVSCSEGPWLHFNNMTDKGVIMREGNAGSRTKANGVLKSVGALQGEYKHCASQVRKAQGSLEIEEQRLTQSEGYLVKKQTALGQVEEVIDADYLPEGAQPVDRIQKRDTLLMVSMLRVQNIINIATASMTEAAMVAL